MSKINFEILMIFSDQFFPFPDEKILNQLWHDQVIEIPSFIFDPTNKTVCFSILKAETPEKIKTLGLSTVPIYRIFIQINNIDAADLEASPEEVELFISDVKKTEKLLEIICVNGKLKVEGNNMQMATSIESTDLQNSFFDSPFFNVSWVKKQTDKDQ